MSKSLVIFCFLIIFAQATLVIFFERSYFLTRYDVPYWKDRYEHSQYQLPLSKRIIGDDGLFAYAGYRLIKGDNPFSINVDKPPVGKYLIGFSILLFQNPAYYALFLGIGSLYIFFLIAKFLLKNSSTALIATTILFLDPLFLTQFWKAWLDIAQLFFLLVNFFLILKITDSNKKQRLLFILLAGLALGLFIETKPPILFPIIFILETIFLLSKKFKKGYLFFILGIITGVLTPYIVYFQLGFGLIDLVKVHKYMTSIYLKSQLIVHKDAIWQTLFFGRFPEVTTGSPTVVSEWSVLWPIIAICAIAMSIFFLFRQNTSIVFKGLAIFLVVTLFIYTLIPSYPRYLVIILPFFYLFLAKGLEQFVNLNLRNFFFVTILLYGVINTFFSLLPKPDLILNNFYYNFSHQYFQDIYQEDLTKENQLLTSREKFRFITQNGLGEATVKAIEIKEKERDIPQFGNKGRTRLEVIYRTQDLGLFSEEKRVDLIKENEQWKVKWNWDFILNKFLPDYVIDRKIILGKRGSILTSDGKILAEDKIGSLISINPGKIDVKKEQEMLKMLEKYNFNRGGVELQNAYLENPIPGEYISILTPNIVLTTEEKRKILTYPGIVLSDYPTRVYNGLDPKIIKNTEFNECCTRIYSSYSYHGIRGVENDYDKVLAGYSGGEITIKDKTGKIIRSVIKKNPKDGKDIVL